jgi:hypothetical protein
MTAFTWPADPDGWQPPADWSWVERCDAADLYPDDEAAAHALARLLGQPDAEVRWFDRQTREPLEDYRPGASAAIHLPEPPATMRSPPTIARK